MPSSRPTGRTLARRNPPRLLDWHRLIAAIPDLGGVTYQAITRIFAPASG
jgi:hypothetical protein